MLTCCLNVALAVFAVATAVQLAVWWGIFAPLARRPVSHQPGSGPPCSVLICARNEAANLRRYLPLVLEQDYPVFEVLVIDDASTDDSPVVLAAWQEKYPQLRVLRLEEKRSPGKKAALAQGIAAARYDVLVCTDADGQPAGPHWLSQLVAAFEQPGVEIVLGYGPMAWQAGGWNRWLRYETIFTALHYLGLAQAGWPYMGVGRNLAWRRDVYQRVGGFAAHADLASGDDDLLVNAGARRGNTAISLDPAAFVYSAGKAGWQSWLRQKRRHLSTGPRYRRRHRIVLAGLALSHILHFGLAVGLLAAGFGTKYVLGGYLLRLASLWLVCRRLFPRWAEPRKPADLLAWLPLLDLLMAGYYAGIMPLFLLQYKRAHPWT